MRAKDPKGAALNVACNDGADRRYPAIGTICREQAKFNPVVGMEAGSIIAVSTCDWLPVVRMQTFPPAFVGFAKAFERVTEHRRVGRIDDHFAGCDVEVIKALIVCQQNQLKPFCAFLQRFLTCAGASV